MSGSGRSDFEPPPLEPYSATAVLAIALPDGTIALNDDFRHRVVIIDPKTNRIVWQYGHTDVPRTALGYLNTPDGLDLIPLGTLLH